MSVALAAIMFLTVSVAAAPSHTDEVATFATAVAVAQVASDRCPEILVFADGLTNLRSSLHLLPADDMAVQLEIRGYLKAFTVQVDREPTAWCEDVLRYFGPGGSLMPGLLKRE